MHGLFSVVVIVLVQTMLAVWLVRRAARRWLQHVAIAALGAALLVPLYQLITGDISRSLPPDLWSDGADGKDQIILASAASTLLLPLIASATLVLAFGRLWAARSDPHLP